MDVSELFPDRYMKGKHLAAGPIMVEVHSLTRTELRPGPGKPAEVVYLLHVKQTQGKALHGVTRAQNGTYSMVLRKTLAHEIAAAIHSTDTDEWSGKTFVLYAERQTIAGSSMLVTRARERKEATPSARDQYDAVLAEANKRRITINGEAARPNDTDPQLLAKAAVLRKKINDHDATTAANAGKIAADLQDTAQHP